MMECISIIPLEKGVVGLLAFTTITGLSLVTKVPLPMILYITKVLLIIIFKNFARRASSKITFIAIPLKKSLLFLRSSSNCN